MGQAVAIESRSARSRRRVRVGRLWIDCLTQQEALVAIHDLVACGDGGAVFTPNVDHIVAAERDAALRGAYRRSSLRLADGVPVVIGSRVLGTPIPEKLSGSDMMRPIAQLAAENRWRVYLLGGAPGAAERAARRMRSEWGVDVVGVDDARIALHADPSDLPVIARIRDAKPDLVLVGLGAPKQELWIDRVTRVLAPAVFIGVGASIEFVSGDLKRAPAWVSRIGFEWFYRLMQEPARLWRRYLINDPKFLCILRHMRRLPPDRRVEWINQPAPADVSPVHALGGESL